VWAAVREETVGEAEGYARVLHAIRVGVGNRVAIALLLLVVVKGFGVGEDDVGALAARNDEFGVRGSQAFAIEREANVAIPIYSNRFVRKSCDSFPYVNEFLAV